jgi:hypothetical protein
MARGNEDSQTKPGTISRRSLIATSAGVATTAAVTVVGPTTAVAMGLADKAPVPVAKPASAIPAHPVIAYVHDAARGEVTVVSGKVERTYRDAALVKRLLAAAKSQGI